MKDETIDKGILKDIIENSWECEDGECGLHKSIEMYCKEEGYEVDIYLDAAANAIMNQSAIESGIPRSVVEGKTKLRDHFSQDYINMVSNVNNKLVDDYLDRADRIKDEDDEPQQG